MSYISICWPSLSPFAVSLFAICRLCSGFLGPFLPYVTLLQGYLVSVSVFRWFLFVYRMSTFVEKEKEACINR